MERRSLGRALVLAAGSILLATGAPAVAQERVVFLAEKQLEGFTACYTSEFSDLYDFEPFMDREGDRLSAPELARLRELWSEEKERVRKKIDRICTDPKAASLYRLDKLLEKHPYLSKIDYRRVDRYDPVILLVQRPMKSRRR